MVNPIEIRTLTGVRLDVYPNATIEVNMGGISLLNLQDRTATYTNSFKMPRTPINESVFAFASQPTRNNRPVVNVIITKGLFQKQAVLKVVDFENDYSCELIYGDAISLIKNKRIEFEQQQYEFDTPSNAIASVCSTNSTITKFHCLYTNTTSMVGYSTEPTINSGNICIKIIDLFDFIETDYGVTFDGDLLSDTDFLNTFLLLPDYSFLLTESLDLATLTIGTSIAENRTNTTLTDVISEICKLFLCDIRTTENKISLNKLNTNIDGVNIETLLSDNKLFSTGYANTNYITYTNEGASNLFGSDSFISGDGVGEKDALKLKAVVPKTDSNGYVTNVYSSLKDKIILFQAGSTVLKNMTIGDFAANVNIPTASILSLTPFYSNILNPIFADPVILNASGYVDPLTADTIMTNRVINSVQLGGRYWVDSMAYNLTTGQSKLTLIKLP